MPNRANDLDSWTIIQNFVQSPFSSESLSVADRECCKRIICWYEKNFSEVENLDIRCKINVVIHRIYVALEQFPEATQVLLSLPYITSDDLTPLIPRNIPVLDTIVTSYTEFLLEKEIAPLNAQTLLLVPNNLNSLFNYMERCLFTISRKHQFNYQYFSEQLNLLLNNQNQLSAELTAEFTRFFRKSCNRRGARKFYQDFDLGAEYKALFEKVKMDEELSVPHSGDALYLNAGNWFNIQKDSIRLILINYPQLISCMFAMKNFTYPNMILEVLNKVEDFHLLLKPFADYLNTDTIRGFSGGREAECKSHTRVYFPRFYLYLDDYLSMLLENYDHVTKIPINILESLTQVGCGLYRTTLPYCSWGKQGNDYIQPLARANSKNVMMIIQLLMLTQHYELLDTLLMVAKKTISKIGSAKKLIELYEGSTNDELGMPTSRYLHSVLNFFANPQELLTFGIKYAPLFHITFLSRNLYYNSTDYAKLLKVTSILTLNYALSHKHISQLISTIPSNQWHDIYNELLKEFHINKNSIISFFNSSQKLKEHTKVDAHLAQILIEITSLVELSSQLREQIVHDFPGCVVSYRSVSEEHNASASADYFNPTLDACM